MRTACNPKVKCYRERMEIYSEMSAVTVRHGVIGRTYYSKNLLDKAGVSLKERLRDLLCYGLRTFVTVVTKAHKRSLFYASWIHFK